MTSPRFGIQVLLLAGITLLLFYPCLSAPLNPLDDRALVQWLYELDGFGLEEVFSRTTDYYYRPVLLTTYLLDMYLWGAETSFLHLENLILHLLNVLLLFACGRILCNILSINSNWLPFGAALLFAIHPVNTEAVNWISARSDLLAGFFVLLAACLLFLGLAIKQPVYVWLSFIPLVPGFFAKETALFFFPAAIFLLLCETKYSVAEERLDFSARLKVRLAYWGPILLLPLLYLMIRSPALLSRDTGLNLFKQYAANWQLNVVDSLATILMGLGFYAKKLFFPWPLNFTIYQVPNYCFWLGLALLPVLLYLCYRRDLLSGLILSSVFLVGSAILAMLLRPAWTPVAERYLYLPSAFFCLSVAFLIHRLWARYLCQRPCQLLLVTLFIVLAATSFDRNLLWRDNIALFEDAVKKSPEFPFAKSVLAGLLIEGGWLEEGSEIIRTTTAPEDLRNADFLDLKRAQLLLAEKEYVSARQLILAKRQPGGQLYYSFQQLLAKVNRELLHSTSGDTRQAIFKETIALHLELSRVYRDPFYLYLLGHIYRDEGDRAKAAEYYRKAYLDAPDQAHYKKAAAVLAEKMLK